MEKFTELHGIAAPLAVPNVNTDVLIRIERLNELPKDQLGPYCFEAWRYDAQGAELPDFVLNKPESKACLVLLAGDNFGCGSSREHAPWALTQYGFRIFYVAAVLGCIAGIVMLIRRSVVKSQAQRVAGFGSLTREPNNLTGFEPIKRKRLVVP